MNGQDYQTSVTEVSLSILEREPNAFLIIVTGHVLTTGAQNVSIAPHYYVQAPPDGIQEFSFGADAPDPDRDSFVQLTPVSTEYVMTEFIEGFAGIRVTGSDGHSIEALVITADETPKSLQIVNHDSSI